MINNLKSNKENNKKPCSIFNFNDDELEKELKKGYEDIKNGKGYPVEEVIKYFNEKYKLIG